MADPTPRPRTEPDAERYRIDDVDPEAVVDELRPPVDPDPEAVIDELAPQDPLDPEVPLDDDVPGDGRGDDTAG